MPISYLRRSSSTTSKNGDRNASHHQPGQRRSGRSCPKTSIGNRYRAFPPRCALPSSSAILRTRPLCDQVKVPAAVKLMPHKHPEDRIYT